MCARMHQQRPRGRRGSHPHRASPQCGQIPQSGMRILLQPADRLSELAWSMCKMCLQPSNSPYFARYEHLRPWQLKTNADALY